MFKYLILFIVYTCANHSVSSDHTPDPVCLQGPQPGVNAASCCRVPNLVSAAVLDKCSGQVPRTRQPPGVCIAECVFNETGYLKDRTFQLDAAKTHLTDMLKDDPEWAQLGTNAIDACTEKMTPKIIERLSRAEEGECMSMSTFYLGCMVTQMFKNCPPSKWTENGVCAELKQNAEKCLVFNAVLPY